MPALESWDSQRGRFAQTDNIAEFCTSFPRSADVPESCEGLDNIGKARKLDCERSADCLSQTCNVTDVFIGYGATLLLFPCDQPPAFEILFNSPKGSNTVEKYDSSTPSRSTAVPLSEEPDGYELEITVFWATPRTAAITVS